MDKARFKKIFSLFKKDLLFFVLFVAFASLYYDSVLDKGPLNVHVWRQTDCLSITRNYSQGADFFRPETNLLLSDDYTTGLSVAEFPILYFAVGKFWKAFGESYYSFRFFYLLILFAGLFAFYKSLLIIFENNFIAIIFSLLIFTSPVYVSYGISFLTDVPAFSFMLIAIFFLLQYSMKKNRKLFFLAMALFSLAGLLKISSLIAFVFLLLILVFETLSFKTLPYKKLFNCSKTEWFGFFSVILIVVSWYLYAEFFNKLHGFKYSAGKIYPLWEVPMESIDPLYFEFRDFTSMVFFSRPMMFVLLLTGIFNLFLLKKIPLLAYLSNAIILTGGLIYVVLWASVLDNHDYYFTALLIWFPGILIPFFWYLQTKLPKVFKSTALKIFLVIFLFYNFFYCLSVVQLKTLARDGRYAVVQNERFVRFMLWVNHDLEQNWKRFEKMKPYLIQIGIKKDDKVISLPDDSSNITLFLSGQKGWTDYGRNHYKEYISKLIAKGAKYLFVSDPKLLNEEYLKPFLNEKAGSYMGIEIFTLQEQR